MKFGKLLYYIIIFDASLALPRGIEPLFQP
jgi:hypothetical protein